MKFSDGIARFKRWVRGGSSPNTNHWPPNAAITPEPSTFLGLVTPNSAFGAKHRAKDFPMRVLGSSNFGNAISAYINRNDMGPLIAFVKSMPLPGKKNTSIELRDLSTSMRSYVEALLAGEAAYTDTTRNIPNGHTSLIQIGFNSNLIPFHTKGCVDLKARCKYSGDLLQIVEPGGTGYLMPGSRISDAFVAGCAIAQALRRKYPRLPLSVNLFTDGDNRHASLISAKPDPSSPNKLLHSDWEAYSEERVRTEIKMARKAKIAITLVGFVANQAELDRLLTFAAKIGLTLKEMNVSIIKASAPDDSIRASMTAHAQAVTGVQKLP